MKIIYFLIIFAFFNNTSLNSNVDLYFRLIETPKGNNTDIGLIQVLKKGEFVLTQYEKGIFYKIYYTKDNGLNWVEKDTNALFTKFAIIVETSRNDFFAGPQWNYIIDGMWVIPEIGLWFSSDYGQTWSWSFVLYYEHQNIKWFTTEDSNEIYIAGLGHSMHTSDYGHEWSQGDDFILDWIYYKNQRTVLKSEPVLGLIKLHFDISVEIISPKSNFPEGRFKILRLMKNDYLVGYSNVNPGTNGIYLSEDGGYIWRKIKPIGEFNEVLVIETYKDVIVAGDNHGLEISYDAGTSWEKCTLPEIETSNKAISKITINQENGDIFCIYGGSYLIKGNLEGIKDSTLDLPFGYYIYPNPVTDKVIISSRGLNLIPNRLSIFNIIGQEMFSKTIDEGRLEVDVSSWATGIYIVRCGVWTGRFLKY